MPVPLVEVVRSGVLESVHLGDIAVCDASGALIASVGDPDRVAFARSCMKPLQGAVSLASIEGPVSDREVAVMCSSHNGEPVHVRAVRSLLKRGGLDEEVLRNPAGRPMDADAASRVKEPARIYQDCSGNHAGMLVASSFAGWPLDSYRTRSHPHHRQLLPLVRRLAAADPVIGVDGCGIPVHGMPLRAHATMYARMSVAADDHPALLRVLDAMQGEPYLVGGRERDDTAVMEATPDLVMKEGAEALDCVLVRNAGIGVAVKIHDGGYRAPGPATIEALHQLGLLPPGARRRLGGGGRPPPPPRAPPAPTITPIFRLSREQT
jgi:L-asparaginase II